MKLTDEIISDYRRYADIDRSIRHIQNNKHVTTEFKETIGELVTYIQCYIMWPMTVSEAKTFTVSLLETQKKIVKERLEQEGIEVE